jgi:filamentous hemagglutinin
MRVPAAEHVRSAGKAGGGQTRAVAAASALTVLLASGAAVAQTRADTTAASNTGLRGAAAAGIAPNSRSTDALAAIALSKAFNPLPTYTLDGDWLKNLGTADVLTTSADGKSMTVVQKDGVVILNWDTFDVGSGHTVQFVQPEKGRALNRVSDMQQDPSVILGTLKANGEIMIENRNGVVFGSTARVDAGKLVTTALKITDEVFKAGIRSMRNGEVVFGGVEADQNGFIAVQAGAEIRTLEGGDVIMVAPRVTNRGKIVTPKGQTILAAGKTVYLYAPLDQAQRGLIVAVDNFNTESTTVAPTLGTVEHSGSVLAEKGGTINLVGAAIRQRGNLTATTAVKGLNGGIFLQAMQDTTNAPAPKTSLSDNEGAKRIANTGGSIELDAGSVTQVLPSTEGTYTLANGEQHAISKPVEPAAPAVDANAEVKAAHTQAVAQYDTDLKAYEKVTQTVADTFYRSRIDVIGADIRLRENSQVLAPAGEVNILAADNWASSSLYQDINKLTPDNSRLVMDAGSVVDVSGVKNLHLSAERAQLKGRLFSIELADTPAQRNGVLYRSEIMADARRAVTVGSVIGMYADVARTAAEMSTTGGVARIQSQGAMILDAGSKVDFSGGSVVYDAGSVVSSLLRKGSEVIRIEDARPDVVYDELISAPTVANSPDNVPEQKVGQSAGAAWLAAPKMAVGATLDGSVVMNDQQRLSTSVAEIDPGLNTSAGLGDMKDESRTVKRAALLDTKPQLYTSLRPTAGLLVLGNEVGDANQPDQMVDAVSFTGQPLGLPTTPAEWTDAAWANTLAGMNNTAVVSVRALNQARLGGLTVTANAIHLGQGSKGDQPSLTMASGGSVSFKGQNGVAIDGQIRAEGGNVALSTFKKVAADVTLGEGAQIDVSGTRVDERFVAGDPNSAVLTTGGKVSIDASRSILVGKGSAIDVSAGVRRSATGALTQGTAGGITLAVNGQDNLEAGTALPGKLQLGGALSGFDFKSGGSLGISGVSAIQLGGAQKADTDLLLDKHLFSDRGFGDVSLSAAGHVDVNPGEQVKLELVNMQAVPARQGSASAALFALDTLEAGRRQGVKVSLIATSAPLVANALPGLESGANIQIGEGALIDAGYGGTIKLKAGGSIDILGQLVARGGQVSATLSGKRGGQPSPADKTPTDVEAYGYLAGQQIHLGSKAVVDVSGVVKSYRPNGEDTKSFPSTKVRELGDVLAGGTVTLGDGSTAATRGQVIVDAGSSINLRGATGSLNRDASTRKSVISAAAGTLNINSSDGITLLGSIQAQAPNASVAGGSININLSRGGLADNVDAAGHAYPAGERSLQVAASLADAKLALNEGSMPFGQAVILADMVNSSGADRVKLKADDKVVLGAGVSLGSDATQRAPLSEVVLNTPVLQVTDGAAHRIEAHHVVLGDVDIVPQLGQVKPSDMGSQGSLAGTGSLKVNAGLIELVGDTAVQGVNKTELSATLGRSTAHVLDRRDGEIRLIGRAPVNKEDLASQFSYAGDLTLRAGQVYATTLSKATVKGFTANGKATTLTVLAPEAGSTSQTPLSALGSMTLSADTVNIDGVLRQPFGSIGIDVNTLKIGSRAVFDVSGNGVQVPVGRTVNGSQWVYAVGGATDAGGNSANVDATLNTVQDLNNLVVDKRISLKGKTLSIQDTAYLNASAGGDLLAWEFKAGATGSTDTLNRKDVFAVLPGYTYDFAPHDTEIMASTQTLGTSLKAGDQVNVLSANGVLAQGSYTLLPARYGILPGAVLVSAAQMSTAAVAGRGIRNDDGSVLVSGYKTTVGSSQNAGGDLKQALLLEPETTFRKKSETTNTSANAFLADRAVRTGLNLALPGEGGRVSLVSDAAFNWAAQFNLAGKAGFTAGAFDLSMDKMVVLADDTEASEAGAGRISMKRLNALGASSVLLGGTRVNTADGTEVSRQASTVHFQSDTDASGTPVAGSSNTLNTTGELMAVAKDAVAVSDGLSIVSTGADTGASHNYVVKGDGATLLVGNLAHTDLRVSGGAGKTGALSLGQVTLKGQAVQADATAGLSVQPGTEIQANTIGLGSKRMAVDAADTDKLATGTLKVSGALLDRLNAAQTLQLRANESIDLYGNTTLGGANSRQVVLDAPQVLGKGAAGQQALVQASEVTLRNASGVAAGTESGASSLLVKATPVLSDGHTGGLTVAASAKSDGSVAGQRLGFASSTLQSSGDVIFSGTGKLDAQGDLTIRSARVTATADSKQTVQSGGLLTITQPRDSQGKLSGAYSLGETVGAGGQLNLVAQRVVQDGLIDIESGSLSITGKGQAKVADAVSFTSQSLTSVAGKVRQLSDDWRIATPGGRLKVTAEHGEIVIDGTLDASAPALRAADNGESGTAGSITLNATGVADAAAGWSQGAVRLGEAARLKLDAGQAGETGLGGTLRVDTGTLAETDAAKAASAKAGSLIHSAMDRLMAQSANTNGNALKEIDLRVRKQDELALSIGAKAERITLTNDQGKITLGAGANLDARAEQGGVVRVMAKGDVTLGEQAQIQAGSTREGANANGGDVLLASDEGSVLLGQGSITANSAADTQGGRIVLRARRNLSATNTEIGSVKVDLLTPATNGAAAKLPALNAGQIDIEGVRVYEDATRTALVNGTNTTTAWGLGSIKTDADNFLTAANKQAVVTTAGLTGNANVHVKAGAEIRSKADTFNLSDPKSVVDLDLSKLRPGTEPIHLTVRATGNLAINGNVSDGFAATGYAVATAKTPTGMNAGDAASYRFVAGADLDSANLTATSAASTANLTVAGGKVVRTTAGSIELAAAGDIKLLSTSSATPINAAVYVAGKPSTLASNESFGTNYAWAQYTERGGRLDVRAGGSVGSYKLDGVSDQMLTQMTGNYFNHAGTNTANVAWWTAFDSFRQGFGSFGGGNIDISAGKDVRNIVAVAPTNARNVSIVGAEDTATSTRSLKELGGGDVNVSAGGDIVGGAYLLGRGNGRLKAGGSVLKGADNMPTAAGTYATNQSVLAAGAMLGVMDGHWAVQAGQDINVSHVFNPTLLPSAAAKAAAGTSATGTSGFYDTYQDDTSVSLSALKGNVDWTPVEQTLNRLHGVQAVAFANDGLNLGSASAGPLGNVAPPVVHITAVQGDATLNPAGNLFATSATQTTNSGVKPLFVAASLKSDVDVYAQGDVLLRGDIKLPDAVQLALPDVVAPATQANASAIVDFNKVANLKSSLDSMEKSPIDDGAQVGNPNLVHVMAGGDINFQPYRLGTASQSDSYSSLKVNRPAVIEAGRDINSPWIVGQNFSADDVTTIKAGRYLTGAPSSGAAIILSGPGQLKVQAGQDINLGSSYGVVTAGGKLNTALPDQAAKITLQAGTDRSVNAEVALANWGADAAFRNEVLAQLADSKLPVPGGAASWSAVSWGEAQAAYLGLSQAHQAAALDRYLTSVFVARYLPQEAGKPTAYYRSNAFAQLKQEAMWKAIYGLASQAVAIKQSSDATEEAKRSAQRKALFAQAAQVADLAGLGASFSAAGDVNLANARVHSKASGAGTGSAVDDTLGGTDVLAAGKVVLGLASASANDPHGVVNYQGGSFRSLTGGDFLAADQKVVIAGKGNLLVYALDGDIDSGKGSNTSVAIKPPTRNFNLKTGEVVVVAEPTLVGSGFQTNDGVIGLYAPNGEIRALDAYIKGPKVEINANKVAGADNIANAEGVPAAPPVTVSLNITPKLNDTGAGVNKAADAAESRKADKKSDSLLTVELLGMGDDGAETAPAAAPCAPGDKDCQARRR